MSKDRTVQAIWDQFHRALGMFREAVQAFPGEEWRKGDIDYLRPAGLAYHVLETIDFYSGDRPGEEFPWGGRFGVGWEESRSERLPSQEQVLAYLDEMEAKLEDWFEKSDLLSGEATFLWTGETMLGRAAYMLRHTQHHVAELGLELRRRGYSRPEWR